MDSGKPVEVVKEAAETVAAKLTGAGAPEVPGAPGSGTSRVEEPTAPQEPLPPKPEQATPEPRTPTGAVTGCPVTAYGQQGPFLTTANGARLRDTDHSLKADAGPQAFTAVQKLLATRRVWQRFPASIA
jgi:catalase